MKRAAVTPNDSIIQKIQKLFALAQSDNEAEAALATARAQELLAKYNLDLAMVKDTPAVKEEKRERTTIDRTAKFKWQKQLWQALAEANFCWYWLQEVRVDGKQRRVKRHVVLGRLSNVQVVRLMGEYLEDTMRRICPFSTVAKITTGPAWARAGAVQRRSQVWYAGCVETLVSRIREKADAMQEEQPSDTTAIALRDVIQREYEANYDALHGAGAYQRKQITDADWEARRAKDIEEAERRWLEYLQNETPEEKAAREKRDAAERRRQERNWARRRYSWGRYSKARDKELEQAEDSDYRAGASAGKDIGLDAQLGARPAGRLK
ncbi:MAG: DUF2786 domain-containing protein [Patescibacteria group bacterium]|nr:DUF2786 domain-containing protein [Patescibacteria group bacterium]